MWTPRRIVVLTLGVAGFLAAYAGYARVLGWLDGLPQLPAVMAVPAKGLVQPPPRLMSPTVQKLIDAFGPDSPEKDHLYPTKLEFRNNDTSMVVAAGPFPFEPGSAKIALAPFSLAVFGKPRPPHLRQPGEASEVSTFHADKAILEFDRAINSPQDMSKAKLVRLELVADPESVLPDPRKGRVHITNNQRSADPNRMLVMRTPGPLFYRDPKALPDTAAASGPDVWTDAPVEIVDRGNLPRRFGGPAPQTAAAKGESLRDGGAVADVLTGRRLPPPTVTAVGMRIYFAPEPDKKAPPPKGGKPGQPSAGGGVRRIELLEKVLVNLWVDGKQNLFSDDKKSADPSKKGATPPPSNPLSAPEPPPAAAAALGGLLDAAQTARQLERALLQIETLGPFAYDVPTSVGRFDVVAQADPSIPNDVQVTRVPPRRPDDKAGGQHKLFSQVLEIEFGGAPVGAVAPPPGAAAPPPAADAGPSFKRLHAWTFTPGRFLTVSAEGEQLEAYGVDLVYEQTANRTTLQGAPLYAVRERNVLTAGTAAKPGLLVMEPGPGPDKKMSATVRGPGRLELFDSAANATTLHASWRTSLTHTKDKLDGRELDLMVFTDDARFDDTRADYWLNGDVLKLWITGKPDEKDRPARKPGDAPDQPLPHRLQALGKVTAHSADFDVEKADHLTVMFRDGVPQAPAKPLPPPAAPVPATTALRPAAPPAGVQAPAAPPSAPGAIPPTPVAVGQPAPAVAGPPKPKPPMKLTARVIDTWVIRYPAAKPPAGTAAAKPEPKADGKPNAAPGGGSVRYELEKARCDGSVTVHQDPTDPEKPRGTDVHGQTLVIDHTPQGSVMTVTGTDDKPGEVHYEGMSILGPKVLIDQLHNQATVDGRGALQMPSNSDLNGAELAEPKDLIIHWRDGMTFSGSKKTAEFTGKVSARQGESWVVCHTMQVVMDRPVYFNQARKPTPTPPAPGKPAPKDDSPKIQNVYCYPVPGDAADDPRELSTITFNDVVRDATGKVTKTQQVTARELELRGSDGPNKERYNEFTAPGPGEVRLWQPGQREMADPGKKPPPADPKAPLKKDAPKPAADTEMKLTVVTFGGRMTVEDKGKLFQKAVFTDNVQVLNLPTSDPAAKVERHKLPAGSIILTCTDRMTVTSHRQPDGSVVQSMEAVGNAYIRSDEYEGWGEVITYDGQFVELKAAGSTSARIMSRFKGNASSGRVIKFNRFTNSYDVKDADSTSLQPQNGGGPVPKPR